MAAAAATAVKAGIRGDADVKAEKSWEYRQAAPRAQRPLQMPDLLQVWCFSRNLHTHLISVSTSDMLS